MRGNSISRLRRRSQAPLSTESESGRICQTRSNHPNVGRASIASTFASATVSKGCNVIGSICRHCAITESDTPASRSCNARRWFSAAIALLPPDDREMRPHPTVAAFVGVVTSSGLLERGGLAGSATGVANERGDGRGWVGEKRHRSSAAFVRRTPAYRRISRRPRGAGGMGHALRRPGAVVERPAQRRAGGRGRRAHARTGARRRLRRGRGRRLARRAAAGT